MRYFLSFKMADFIEKIINFFNLTTNWVGISNAPYENLPQDWSQMVARNGNLYIRIYTSFFVRDNQNTFGITFINDGNVVKRQLTYEQVKYAINILLEMNRIIYGDDELPISFYKFEYFRERRIQILEELRLEYFNTLTLQIDDGFSYDVRRFEIPNDNLPVNKYYYDDIKRVRNFNDVDVLRISYTFQPYRYTITLNNNQTHFAEPDLHIMKYLVDEVLRNNIVLQTHDLRNWFTTFNINDPTIQYYNNNTRQYMEMMIPNEIHIQGVRQPYPGNNPKNKITFERISCNANDIEDGKPVDPIDLQPIPDNLLVTVVSLEGNVQTYCFNAFNLWEFWKSIANSNPPRSAINPLNNLEFDAESIVLVSNLLDQLHLK